ncbi:MAG: thiamine pyrophosphate-dependent enzyme [Balneolaceae bacterium]
MKEIQKNFSGEEWLHLYRSMVLPRSIEYKMIHLLRQNKLKKWFSGIGQEAISVGTALAADPNDLFLPMHRNLGLFTTLGVPLYPLFCQLLGKRDGFTKGRDRSFHFGLPDYNIIGMISHLAATLPVATGLALAVKMRDEQRVLFSFCGEGSTSEGDFHEAVNLAAVWNLPVIFLIENNGYALSTPVSQQYASKRLSDRAAGYGIEGLHIDGNDLLAVMDGIETARSIALTGRPVLIEAETFRIRGHEEASGTWYLPEGLREKWEQRDPIALLESQITEAIAADKKLFQTIRNESEKSFLPQLERALEAPYPEFDSITEKRDAALFFPADKPETPFQELSAGRSEKRFVDAIQLALRQAMREEQLFLLMGQDVAEYGGVFKVTEGFLEEFGEKRIRNTPIIESGVLGCALGLALERYFPIVEIQFADFLSCGYNQIVNHIAKGRYRWMPPLNITIRAPHGAGVGAGPFHSQSPESWFMQEPGLRILVPSTVQDAQDMLYSALFDPNPVLFLEHKKLYRSLKEPSFDTCRLIDLGRASVIHPGKDASIITYGLGVHWALNLVQDFEKRGYSLEIIDLKSLSPVDWECVERSIKKTSRALLLQESSELMGPMSEIASFLAGHCFEYLDAPVVRCSSLNTPIPFHPNLEAGYLALSRLSEQLEELLAY